MPYSALQGKAAIGLFCALWSRKEGMDQVIDVGAGSGAYAGLLRGVGAGKRLVAIEVWAPYVAAFSLNGSYDEVVCADARFVDYSTFGPIDVAFCGDVLQLMSMSDAQAFMGRLLRSARVVIVSAPIVPLSQGEVGGNPFEAHVQDSLSLESLGEFSDSLCLATSDDFMGVGFYASSPSVGERVGLLAHDVETLAASYGPLLNASGVASTYELGLLLRSVLSRHGDGK